MSEWQEVALGSLTTKIGSGATPTGGENAYKTSGISLIRSQNILDFQFSYNGLAYIDDAQAKKLANVSVEASDILLNITGDSVARCCIVNTQCLPARVNQHVAIIRINPTKADYRFIFYYLQFLKSELLQQSEIGATRRALTKSMIEKLELMIPPLQEQKAIAEVLSSLDDKIDLLHRQNKTLESIAETLFRQWFVEEADDSWEQGQLEDLITFNPERKLPKGVSTTYLEMSNLSNQNSIARGWRLREFTSGMRFTNSDSLLARITPCLENGKTCFVNFLNEGEIGWGSTEFIVMRTKPIYHPFISYLVAKSEEFREFAIANMSGTSGRQRVDAKRLKQYSIKRPPQSHLLKLNKALGDLVPKIKNNLFQIRGLEKLRDTLLPKLISGKILAQ